MNIKEAFDYFASSIWNKCKTKFAFKTDVYTKVEVDNKLLDTSDSSHTHDDRYYTETEVDNKLNECNGLMLSSILPSGQTTLTFSDTRITDNSILASVYTSKFGVIIKNAEIDSGSLTLIFKEQTEDITVNVVIK